MKLEAVAIAPAGRTQRRQVLKIAILILTHSGCVHKITAALHAIHNGNDCTVVCLAGTVLPILLVETLPSVPIWVRHIAVPLAQFEGGKDCIA